MAWPPSFLSFVNSNTGGKESRRTTTGFLFSPSGMANGKQQQRMDMGRGGGGTCQTFRAAFFVLSVFVFLVKIANKAGCRQLVFVVVPVCLVRLEQQGEEVTCVVSWHSLCCLYLRRLLPHTLYVFIVTWGGILSLGDSLWGLENRKQASMATRFAIYVHRGGRAVGGRNTRWRGALGGKAHFGG